MRRVGDDGDEVVRGAREGRQRRDGQRLDAALALRDGAEVGPDVELGAFRVAGLERGEGPAHGVELEPLRVRRVEGEPLVGEEDDGARAARARGRVAVAGLLELVEEHELAPVPERLVVLEGVEVEEGVRAEEDQMGLELADGLDGLRELRLDGPRALRLERRLARAELSDLAPALAGLERGRDGDDGRGDVG